jgi:hypothetical protein
MTKKQENNNTAFHIFELLSKEARTKKEMLEVAYDMTANDFKQFLKTDNFSVWRF